MFNFENENLNVSRGTFENEVLIWSFDLKFLEKESADVSRGTFCKARALNLKPFSTFHVEQKNKEFNSENRLKRFPRE